MRDQGESPGRALQTWVQVDDPVPTAPTGKTSHQSITERGRLNAIYGRFIYIEAFDFAVRTRIPAEMT
jgi:hypothetical protein